MIRRIVGLMCLILGVVLLALESHESIAGILPLSERLVPAVINLAVALILIFQYRLLSSDRRVRFLKSLSIMLTTLVGLVVTGFSALSIYVDIAYSHRANEGVYDDCYKVWAARGLVEGGTEITHKGQQNSIESIGRAFNAGAKGTEVDVHFDVDQGRFIVSHDFPYNLKNGEILPLEKLLEAMQGEYYYWLDFKKLRHLDDAGLMASVEELKRLRNRFGLDGRFYVEGEAPFSLAAFKREGFPTIFDSHPVADDHPLSSTVITLYKIVYQLGNFDVMGMNYYYGSGTDPVYGSRTQRLLAGIPVFIYHVPEEPEILHELAAMDTVRVMLVVHHNLNRYDVTACAEGGAGIVSKP